MTGAFGWEPEASLSDSFTARQCWADAAPAPRFHAATVIAACQRPVPTRDPLGLCADHRKEIAP